MSSLTASTQNTETVTLSVTEIIKDNLCIASEDGQKVYDRVAKAFKEGKSVVLSFKNCEDFTRGFLIDAIGQLYESFSEVQIRNSLSIVDIEPEDAEYIEDVICWTKRYLADPERFKEAAREFLGDDDE